MGQIVYYDQIEQGSEEWLTLREGKVTASNAHLLLTLGLERALEANKERFMGNRFTKWGHNNEPFARHLYGEPVREVAFITNAKIPHAGYSPDGLVGDDGLLEIKCFQEKNHKELLKITHASEVPFKIMAQCQFGMMVAKRKWCDLVAFNPTLQEPYNFKVFRIKRDSHIHKNILDKLKAV